MSNTINQQQSPVIAYPAVSQTNSSPAAYVATAPPPPVGYPTMNVTQQSVPVQTTSRGERFWEGCCAGLCCCCALDCCL